MTTELPDEAVEAGARALSHHLFNGRHEAALRRMSDLFTPEQAAETAEAKRNERLGDVELILTAAAPIIEAHAKAEALRDLERTLFDIEGKHHFHNVRCLCGFESHRSRSRTEHITGLVRAATLEGKSE